MELSKRICLYQQHLPARFHVFRSSLASEFFDGNSRICGNEFIISFLKVLARFEYLSAFSKTLLLFN